MAFSKGCNPSAPEHLAARRPVADHPDVGARLAASRDGRVALPASPDLASYEPPRADQDGTDCCWAHSTAWATATACAAAGAPLGYIPSPAEIARVGYAVDRAVLTPPGSPLPALVDQGSEIATAKTALGRYGVVAMTAPVAGRNSDATPQSVIAEPALLDLELGAEKLVAGEYAIDPNAPDVGDQVAACLASGIPVVAAFYCDSSVENWTAGAAPVGAPNASDPNGGGHAVYISGVQTAPDGTRTWLVSNSWGSAYGESGRFRASDAWLRGCWELWPWAIAKKGAP